MIYQRKPDYISETVADETLVYYPGSPRAVCMSRTASIIWSLCEKGATAASIADAISATYSVAADTIAPDVEAALELLLEHGAVTAEGEDGVIRDASAVAAAKSAGRATYSRAPGFIFEAIDDEVLLYYPGSQRAVHMSLTAAMVWSLSDGTATAAAIVRTLQSAYPDAAGQIEEDVYSTIARLHDCGALARA